MLTSRLRLLAALAVLTGCAATGPLPQTAETAGPATLPAAPAFDLDALAEAYDQDDAVYLRYWITDEHAFGPPRRDRWVYVEDRTAQYVVLDPDAEWVSTTAITTSSSDVLIDFTARVTSPDGETATYGLVDLVVEDDGPRDVYKLAFPGVVRGSLVEQRHRVQRTAGPTVTPPLYEEYPLQYPAPVQSLRVRYVAPEFWGLQVKAIGPGRTPAYESFVDSVGSQRVTEFVRTDVPAYRDEPFSPFFKETGEYAEIRVTGIDAGAAQYRPAETWEELGEEFSRYAYRRGRLFSAPVGSATRAALPDRTISDSLKLVRIVEWVQNTIELGTPSRDDLQRMLDERKGNPLLICGLTEAMLDEVGIESEFLLIHPNSEGHFDETFVSASQLTIPAVGATIDGERYVVFPFFEGLPVNYIPPPFQGARAARITADGFGGFTVLPTRDRDTYAVDEAYAIEIDGDGRVSVEETKTLRGIAAYVVRSRLADLEGDERDAEVRELLTYTEGDVEGFGYDLVRLEEYGTPFEIRLRYAIDNLVTVTPEEVLFQTGGLLSPASLGAFNVDARERALPIRIHYDEVTNKRIEIRYPDAWTLTTDLADVATENAFGEVTGQYRLSPGSVVAEQRVFLRESDAPASDYADLLRLTGSESGLYVPTLVFSVE